MDAAPRFVAHRFGRAYGPDSSLQALDRALSKPLGGLETDCCLTADGQIALLHDTYLPHGTTLDGWADARTLAELEAARLRDSAGHPTEQRPLTLEWLLERMAGLDMILQLEIKAFADQALAERTARRVCELVTGPFRDTVEVISFWPSACAVAAEDGLQTRVIIACPYTPQAFAEWASEQGVSGVILEAPYWSQATVDVWRGARLSIMCGVVNDAALLARVLPWQPDAVSSDRPHELAAEVALPQRDD